MKRLIALLLSLTLLASFSTTAFAAEYWDESAGSGESEVYAHLYSSYTVTIPATIDLRNGEMGAVTVSDANIESGYSVKVYCTNIAENGIRLYHTEDENISITCTLIDLNNNCNYTGETPLATFTQSEFTDATLTKYFGLEIMDRWSRAGDYVGTMQYSFECSPIAE